LRILRDAAVEIKGLAGDGHPHFWCLPSPVVKVGLAPNAWQQRLTRRDVVEEIDRLLDQYNEIEIAAIPDLLT
jgi:hypothetical protein